MTDLFREGLTCCSPFQGGPPTAWPLHRSARAHVRCVCARGVVPEMKEVELLGEGDQRHSNALFLSTLKRIETIHSSRFPGQPERARRRKRYRVLEKQGLTASPGC